MLLSFVKVISIGEAIPATYLPYDAMLPYDVTNLLVAGTASGICSFSWGELRVLPNLCVLGDAAGVILAYLIRRNSNSVTLHSMKNSPNCLEDIRMILNSCENNTSLTLNKMGYSSWGCNDAITEKTDVIKKGVWHNNYCPDWNEFVYPDKITNS